MKTVVSFLLFSMIMVFPVCAVLTFDGMEYEMDSDSTVSLNKIVDLDTLIIPEQISYQSKVYTVTGIKHYCFSMSRLLKTLVLPSTINHLDNRILSFSKIECFLVDSKNPHFVGIDGVLFSKDTSIIYAYPVGRKDAIYALPSSVKTIKAYAFSKNKYLKQIKNVQLADSIEKEAFSYCEFLKTIQLSPALKMIPASLFEGCRQLTTIQIPNSVHVIGQNAFNSCIKLTNIYIPKNVTSIVVGAFDGVRLKAFDVDPENAKYCSLDGVLFNKKMTILIAYPSLKEDTYYGVPKSVVQINDRAFSEAIFLQEIRMSNRVERIGSDCFLFCESLIKIKLSSKLKYINRSTFEYCGKIRSIDIPKGVHTIYRDAFSDCDDLTRLTLPKGLDTIMENAFSDCKSLKQIEVKQGNKKYKSLDGVLYNSQMTELIMYPPMKDGTTFRVPESVNVIHRDCFDGTNNLQYLYISKNVTDIRYGAMISLISLRKVEFEGLINKLPENFLSGCSYLTQVVLPMNLLEIPESAFSGCASLSTIVLPENLKVIDQNAFKGCTSLSNIQLPTSLLEIGRAAFENCNGLKAVVLPKGIQLVAPSTFKNCIGLKQVQLPESLRSIQEYAFQNCQSLSQLTIPSSVSFVGVSAFSGCKNLSKLVLQNPKPFVLLEKTFENVPLSKLSVEVPKGSVEAFKALKSWSNMPGITEIQP